MGFTVKSTAISGVSPTSAAPAPILPEWQWVGYLARPLVGEYRAGSPMTATVPVAGATSFTLLPYSGATDPQLPPNGYTVIKTGALPPGIVFNTATGTFSGTRGAISTHEARYFTIRATNDAGSVEDVVRIDFLNI